MLCRSIRIAALFFVGCTASETPPPPAPVVVHDAGLPDTGPPPRPRGTFLGGEAIQASSATAPITGGTLLAAHDSRFVFASNPDYDLVDVVDLQTEKTIWQPRVGQGAEPGRLAEDPRGVVWVVLRRAGMIAALDPVAQTVTKRSVCPAPRGIASTQTDVWVACTGGELVRVPLDGGSTQTLFVETDLRDVIARPDGSLLLTRFRSAELLYLDGPLLQRGQLVQQRVHPWTGWFAGDDPLVPHIAWHAVLGNDGSLYVLHQYASTRIVHVDSTDPSVVTPTTISTPFYGQDSITATPTTAILPTPLSLVTGAVTHVVSGVAEPPTPIVSAIDVAVSPHGEVAIGAAMLSDGGPGVVVFGPGLAKITRVIPTTGIPVGVAYTPNGHLVMQMRDPSEIDVDTNMTRISISPSMHDTGFAIFHRPTMTGLACMSCHPEGGDDGHTWRFGPKDGDSPVRLRRTQSIRGGVTATAPFHWTGDMHDMSQLAHDVFTTRMGGDVLTEDQIAILARWLDWIPSLPPSIADPAAVLRGKAVFASAGCDGCHRGVHLTDNLNHDVGTGGLFQTPSLVNVGMRAPYMHDGCAPDLMSRLTNVACSGDMHGGTQVLTQQQRSDLVAYLESL